MSECKEMRRDTYELEHVNRPNDRTAAVLSSPEITSILTVAAKRIANESQDN
jgi:hypothetical protein